jgi:CheY-like chemotaxis protein
VTVPPSGLAVDADPERLSQIISNLLTNAARYTEPEGAIDVQGFRDGDAAVLTVRDDGIGISSEMLPRVFELFAQEAQSLDRSQGGLGLGLAIVRTLVAMHGGTITAHSDGKGHGSTFTLRLPRLKGAIAQAAAAHTDGARTQLQGGKRILIVDDNVDAAEMLGLALESLGCSIRVAHDGPAALLAASSFCADIALLDIGLPVMDGYELARRLRELPGFAKTRLIAVTGYGQRDDRRRSTAAGFDGHLVKPVRMEAIETLVRGKSRAPHA